ncbi:predicted protein [Nematostella vectensis]|uniref:Pre-mRNA-splicing regulator WTAP n=1 Tax=Nematostella vectensis TaxID=45351 RepID=A7RPH4_NEMVE|nr:pre-mRNA-splicing regulator WTAP [Nematostella vectensis]EDO46685.1 predicted protein [Nematostella vectensis]|eukprot:XP_001638748.1 predicted protein [Nematostella vectensis]
MADKEEDRKRASSESKEETVPKKVCLEESELKEATKELLTDKWKEQLNYIAFLESQIGNGSNSNTELVGLRESEEKLKQQQQESTRRENVLVMRLATKEHEVQDLLTQIHDLKQAQNPSTVQMRSTLLDPAVNLLFQRMKTELDEAKVKLEQAQNDLSAWKFTPDSVTGKKLMAKCRMLIQENQELGRQLSQGRIAQLEAELALQKKYSDELKSSQDELNDFVIQLDEEVEGMQSTIMTLQQQIKDIKQRLATETTTSQELRTKCHQVEKCLSEAKEQNATLALSLQQRLESKDTKDDEPMEIEPPNDTKPDRTTEQTQPSPPPPETVTTAPPLHKTSAFSISNILSDSIVSKEMTVPIKLENGDQGELTVSSTPPPLEPSDSQTVTSKGFPEAIGAEVAAYNVETVK